MDQNIGKMLDNRYELIELIGRGGMANVYKAKCHRLNRMVAVKILKSDLADNAEFRRRFRDESQAVAKLSHANIVSVYDVSRSDDMEYIVMELIDGITLKQYMERRGQMDWREALHFVTQIMRALSHAHSRGIIHRDIKPQNIMVLRDGSVKVADFGIACLADAAQTLTQEALGSVHYISPEQARGDRIDARSDIYSSGVVLYEMLTGRLPFEGDSAVSVAIQHLSSVPLSPRDINENVPEALELICMKAMNPNPDRRYASAEAMLEDLEKFRKDPSTNMEYIRAELKEKDDVEPTQPIPADEVASAVRKTRKTDEKPLQENNKMNKKLLFGIIGGFAALLILIFAAFKIFGNFGDSENGTYVVPDIRGYTVEQAENLPGVKGIFTIEVLGSKPSTQYEPGQIMEQDPAKDHTRKNNLTIKVYLCAEEQKYYMPNLIGYDSREAKLLLDNMDIELNVTFKETYDDQVPAGQVISTTPASDSELKKGNNVLVFVSLGKETKPVTVPSFIGMTLENAIAKAQELGLAVGGTTYQTSDVTVGKVIDQSLAVNSTVEEGTAISFTVSKGQETPVDDPTDNPPVVPPDNPGDSGEDPSVPQGGEGTPGNAH
ncbi:MAG: Stk1 family PASTA domain-containing Ser/Thr kinase [Oscillospiraceae bacterium]|nr:Stk1 family PASTA domain-containing Ser/Thr kinase [Oscillospiraceae bacterium]